MESDFTPNIKRLELRITMDSQFNVGLYEFPGDSKYGGAFQKDPKQVLDVARALYRATDGFPTTIIISPEARSSLGEIASEIENLTKR